MDPLGLPAWPRWCQTCDDPILSPDDAVYIGHEEANSGPGWDIWAHRARLQDLRPDPDAERALAHVLVTQALTPETPSDDAESR